MANYHNPYFNNNNNNNKVSYFIVNKYDKLHKFVLKH